MRVGRLGPALAEHGTNRKLQLLDRATPVATRSRNNKLSKPSAPNLVKTDHWHGIPLLHISGKLSLTLFISAP
jgi:hypothetical protein